jgi:Spy/CpxP family protein refolding chaperone
MKKFTLFLTCAALALAPFATSASAEETTPPPARERGARGAQRGNFQRGPAVKLTPEERTKLRAAVAKASKDAKVIAAKKELKAALEKLNAAVKTAVVADDPSLKDVVAKYGEKPLPGSVGHGGPGGPGGDRPAGARGKRAKPATPPPAE